jgi:hypothetical protein
MKYIAPVMSLFVLSGSPIAAACGWVLWERTVVPTVGLASPTTWRIITATPDYEPCIQERAKSVGKALDLNKSNPGTVSPVSENEVILWSKTLGTPDPSDQVVTFLCLPSNLDPRSN